jgi:hypothetical protein
MEDARLARYFCLQLDNCRQGEGKWVVFTRGKFTEKEREGCCGGNRGNDLKVTAPKS